MYIQSSYTQATPPAATADPAQRGQRNMAADNPTTSGAGSKGTSDTVTLSPAARQILAAPSGSPLLASQTLLTASQNNIGALQQRISLEFPQFLAQNNIPSAPESITYDADGKAQLPPDYPYAAQLQQALEKDPAMARNLSTVNALASHWAEMGKSMPFQQEYAAASPSAAGAVVAKYSHLFSGYQPPAAISLRFSEQGQLSVAADGKAIA